MRVMPPMSSNKPWIPSRTDMIVTPNGRCRGAVVFCMVFLPSQEQEGTWQPQGLPLHFTHYLCFFRSAHMRYSTRKFTSVSDLTNAFTLLVRPVRRTCVCARYSDPSTGGS